MSNIELRITLDPENGLNVHHGDKHAGGHLTVGEMLEQVLALLKVPVRPVVMRTDEEWENGRKMGENAFKSLLK